MSNIRAKSQSNVTSSVTPSSKSGHIWSFDEDGNICINIEHCVTGEDLKIPASESVVTGIKFPGNDEIYEPDENGCITLPADKFSTGELSEDGTTLTVIMNGLDMPVDICLDPVKGAVIIDENGDVITEIPVVDGILQLPDLSQCWGYDDNGDIVTNIPNCITGDLLVICGNPVKEVTQGDDGVTTVSYADGYTEEIEPSYAEDNGDGTTTTYHPDGSEHTTSDSPVLTVNGVGPDADGNVNPADLFSTTVDNGDGTFTTTNSDGTPITWSGDTFASQSDNGDGTATITFNDGSTLTVAMGSPVTAVDNGDGTCTISIGSKQVTVDSSPKDCVLTVNGESPDNDGDVSLTQYASWVQTVGAGGVITYPSDHPLAGQTVSTGLDQGTEVVVNTDSDGINPVASKYARNPYVNKVCTGQGITRIKCNGNEEFEGRTFNHIAVNIIDGSLPAIDQTTPTGMVAMLCGQVPAHNVTTRVRIEGVHSLIFERLGAIPSGEYPNGKVDTDQVFSTDGGATFQRISKGGTDTARVDQLQDYVGSVGEFEYFNWTYSNLMPAGLPIDVCAGVTLLDNSMLSGQVDLNRMDFTVTWIQDRCV